MSAPHQGYLGMRAYNIKPIRFDQQGRLVVVSRNEGHGMVKHGTKRSRVDTIRCKAGRRKAGGTCEVGETSQELQLVTLVRTEGQGMTAKHTPSAYRHGGERGWLRYRREKAVCLLSDGQWSVQ